MYVCVCVCVSVAYVHAFLHRLGNRSTRAQRCAHLRQDLVQPHERSVQVYLHPARGAGDVLAVVLRPPALDEAHPDGAHLGEFVDGFEAVVDRLGQHTGKLLVVEDLEAALWRNLTDGGRMEPVRRIAVPALDKDGRVAQTLGKDLPADREQVDALSDVSSSVLDGRVAMHARQETNAKAVSRGGGVCESIHDHVVARRAKYLADAVVKLVVSHRTPIWRFLVLHGHHYRTTIVCRGTEG